MSDHVFFFSLVFGGWIATGSFLWIVLYGCLGRRQNAPLSKGIRTALSGVLAWVISGLWVGLASASEEDIFLVLLGISGAVPGVGTIFWLCYRAWEKRKGKRWKRIVISAVSTAVVSVLLVYLWLGFCYRPFGVSGFSVMHGTLRMAITHQDYVKVGEDKYLYQTGSLGKLIENEYDSIRFETMPPAYSALSEIDEAYFIKGGIVTKDGRERKIRMLAVWNSLTDGRFHCVYCEPQDEGK